MFNYNSEPETRFQECLAIVQTKYAKFFRKLNNDERCAYNDGNRHFSLNHQFNQENR